MIAGLSAPVMGYLYSREKIGNKALLVWNVIGLVLVLLITFNAILLAELPFQQFAFEQPKRGVTYFPFVLLPAVVVPIVIYTHLTDILKLIKLNAQP